MRLVYAHHGQLHVAAPAVAELSDRASKSDHFFTGFHEWDAMAPSDGLSCGAVHELIWDPAHPQPRFVALMLARAALEQHRRAIIWCDPHHELYPPAILSMGVPVDRLLLLRPQNAVDELWALTECLRSRGVAAIIASPPAMSRVWARRFQLAAEQG